MTARNCLPSALRRRQRREPGENSAGRLRCLNVTSGTKRTSAMNGLISIFIAQGKLDEFRLHLLAGMKTGVAANHHQIAFAQSRKDLVRSRHLLSKFDRSFLDL